MAKFIQQVIVTATRTPHGFINAQRRLGERLPYDGIDRDRALAEVYMAIMDREGVPYRTQPANS